MAITRASLGLFIMISCVSWRRSRGLWNEECYSWRRAMLSRPSDDTSSQRKYRSASCFGHTPWAWETIIFHSPPNLLLYGSLTFSFSPCGDINSNDSDKSEFLTRDILLNYSIQSVMPRSVLRLSTCQLSIATSLCRSNPQGMQALITLCT